MSQHALKSLAPGVAQFNSFSLSQRPTPRRVLHENCHEWVKRTKYSCLWRVSGAWTGKMDHHLTRRHSFRGRKIWAGDDPAYLGSSGSAKRSHSTCQEAQSLKLNPGGWGRRRCGWGRRRCGRRRPRRPHHLGDRVHRASLDGLLVAAFGRCGSLISKISD